MSQPSLKCKSISITSKIMLRPGSSPTGSGSMSVQDPGSVLSVALVMTLFVPQIRIVGKPPNSKALVSNSQNRRSLCVGCVGCVGFCIGFCGLVSGLACLCIGLMVLLLASLGFAFVSSVL